MPRHTSPCQDYREGGDYDLTRIQTHHLSIPNSTLLTVWSMPTAMKTHTSTWQVLCCCFSPLTPFPTQAISLQTNLQQNDAVQLFPGFPDHDAASVPPLYRHHSNVTSRHTRVAVQILCSLGLPQLLKTRVRVTTKLALSFATTKLTLSLVTAKLILSSAHNFLSLLHFVGDCAILQFRSDKKTPIHQIWTEIRREKSTMYRRRQLWQLLGIKRNAS